MSNFTELLPEIIAEAQRLNQLHKDSTEQSLFNELNNLDSKHIEKVRNRYSKADKGRPVNNLRREIGDLLLSGTKFTKEELETIIEERENGSEKQSYKSWGSYSILFPYISMNIPGVKKALQELGNRIIQSLRLESIAARPKVVNFNGPRSFGTDHVWMAIYNNKHAKQTTAIQLFLLIDHAGLSCHLYDRFLDQKLQSITIGSGEAVEEEIIRFFSEFREAIIEDGERKEIRQKNIGVQGAKVYKISHGVKDFNLQEIQYCIDHNIVVIHKETKGLARENKTQYDDFTNAKP
ncbi:MAG: hypothetical protein HRT68_12005, partial [Flavobacteriaceae bacterium]|nr:hypothetical protein [Flavobacteriaceae bacterium]